MPRNLSARLQLEELGSRILPSVSTVIVPIATHTITTVATTTTAQSHALTGHGAGTYTSGHSVPDVGQTYQFDGTADLAALGNVTVKGGLHSVGFVAQGEATGRLTFTNAKGSVTVELVGPVQAGFAVLPERFTYQVVNSSGAFKNLRDHGTLQLQLKPAASGDNGTFQVQLQSVPPPPVPPMHTPPVVPPAPSTGSSSERAAM
jgi:hypothetical protein